MDPIPSHELVGARVVGELPSIVSGCPLIQPAPIPPLAHRQVDVRFASSSQMGVRRRMLTVKV
jgi:hypothetical protein